MKHEDIKKDKPMMETVAKKAVKGHEKRMHSMRAGGKTNADMKKMAQVPRMLEWWKITDPMQVPFETRKDGEWWADMEDVFHTD